VMKSQHSGGKFQQLNGKAISAGGHRHFPGDWPL